MSRWQQTIYELIQRTSTDLPADVEKALHKAAAVEAEDSNARQALEVMLENIRIARREQRPLCQDTGTLLFYIDTPRGFDETTLRDHIESATVQATQDGFLRQNAVDPVSGVNTGNNLGAGSPSIHVTQSDRRDIHIRLMLKGGGCENVGRQYTLPDADLQAGRDLEGVRKCLLDAVYRAQGFGCAPGVLGVCLGGDRASSYAESKRQLLRHFGDRGSDPELAALERQVLYEANNLEIGPMGFGGRTTLLEVFIGALCRVPASYFVSISYMCWSYRRQGLTADLEGRVMSLDVEAAEQGQTT